MALWDPAAYDRFADHRLRPALDLAARIPVDAPESIWDLGCGTGGGTIALAERWPDARVVGLDRSMEMLAAAPGHGRVTWQSGDIATWSPERPTDVIVSNAALQWLGNHDALFRRLAAALSRGGVLAVQMPHTWDQPSHVLLRNTAALPPFRDRTEHLPTGPPVADPAWYHQLLTPMVGSLDVWETTYFHPLSGDNPVAHWMRGAAARPYIEALGDSGDAFFAEYSAKLAETYPRRSDGVTLLGYRRLFIIGVR